MSHDSITRDSRVANYRFLGAAVVAAGCILGCSVSSQADKEQPVQPATQGPVRFEPVDFPEGNAELRRLSDRFGANHYSWHYEEWFVRDFFDDMHGGFFLDVGAGHHASASNTFFLENALEWSGIAIDAQERYRAGYHRRRPRTQYFTYFVADESTGVQDLHIPDDVGMASGDKASLEHMGMEIRESVQIPKITLNDLLDREGVEKIDFLSMDIELAEPAALRGFDIRRFGPKLVCIEEVRQNRDVLEGYFRQNGYARIELWSRIDSYNAYYAPLELVEASGIP